MVRLTVREGRSYLDSDIMVELDEMELLRGGQLAISQLFRRFVGQPVRRWPDLATENGPPFRLPRPAASLSSAEQMLLKAVCLVYLWVEPDLLPQRTPQWRTRLLDEFIVDYAGREGQQSFIYFPPEDLQGPSEHQLNRLHELGLLSRLDIHQDQDVVTRFFTPLVVPGLPVASFDPEQPTGGPVYAYWLRIRNRMQARVQRFISREVTR